MKSGNLMIKVLRPDGDDQDLSGAHATVRLRLVVPASVATLLRQTTSDADAVEVTIVSLREWLDQHTSASPPIDAVMSDLCPGAWKTLKRSKDSLADLQCGVNFIK